MSGKEAALTCCCHLGVTYPKEEGPEPPYPALTEEREMAVAERMESLKTKHAALDRTLDDAVHRPLPDEIEVVRLKKEKLRLKDEMARLDHF
jgi:hypothetical protein